jgi:hypothetical protein
MESEKDIRQLMEGAISRILPKIIKDMVNNILFGTVVGVNESTYTVDVSVAGTEDTYKGVRYHKGAGTVNVGDQAILISQDPKTRGQIRAIIF